MKLLMIYHLLNLKKKLNLLEKCASKWRIVQIFPVSSTCCDIIRERLCKN